MIHLRHSTIFLTFAAILYLPAFANNNSQNATTKQPQIKKEWLFVQQAKTAELKNLPQQPGRYQLTLTYVSANTIAFTDRPYRQTAVISNQQLIQNWNHQSEAFKQDPPNAALEFVSFKRNNAAGMHTSVYQLVKAPKYDRQAKQLTYTVKPLHQYAVITGTYQDVAVFIDDFTQKSFPPSKK